MKIIKHDPFREIERFFEDDWFGLMPAVKRSLLPPTDIYQTETDLVVELQVPKIDPSKVRVTVEDGVLTIDGGEWSDEEEKGKDFYRREIRRGHFSRVIQLPFTVKEEKVEATYENGILRIRMPKTEVKKPKKVEIKVK